MKFKTLCPTCQPSTRKGLLWLGGGDWVECPTCNGTGILEGDESRYKPEEKLVFVPGSAMRVQRKHYLRQQQEQEDLHDNLRTST